MGLSHTSWCLESRTKVDHFTLVLDNLNWVVCIAWTSPRALGVWNQEPFPVYFDLVLENLNCLEGYAWASPRALGVWNQEQLLFTVLWFSKI
jgi:hypothetical protein